MIGLLYFLCAVCCGFVGYGFTVFIRLELSVVGCGVLFGDYNFYNVCITAHGLLMIFAFIMPVFMGGFANYFVPMIMGAPDMLFPRINNCSLLLFLLGFFFVLFGVVLEEGVGVGWTLYPTLICYDFFTCCAVDFLLFAVHFLGISSLLNAFNLMLTVLCGRTKFFVWFFVCLFLWGVVVSSFLLVLCLPVLAGGVTMLLFDRNLNSCFYDFVGGGDLLLFQHLFWFFGHPEVYVIILPVFGLFSSVIDCCMIRCVFSCLAMIYSILLICLLGFFVWAHHMFLSGLDVDSRAFFGCLTLVIGLPTAIKLFNWLFCFFYVDMLCVELLIFFFFCGVFFSGWYFWFVIGQCWFGYVVT